MTCVPLPVFKVIGRRDDLEKKVLRKTAILHVVIAQAALITEI